MPSESSVSSWRVSTSASSKRQTHIRVASGAWIAKLVASSPQAAPRGQVRPGQTSAVSPRRLHIPGVTRDIVSDARHNAGRSPDDEKRHHGGVRAARGQRRRRHHPARPAEDERPQRPGAGGDPRRGGRGHGPRRRQGGRGLRRREGLRRRRRHQGDGGHVLRRHGAAQRPAPVVVDERGPHPQARGGGDHRLRARWWLRAGAVCGRALRSRGRRARPAGDPARHHPRRRRHPAADPPRRVRAGPRTSSSAAGS